MCKKYCVLQDVVHSQLYDFFHFKPTESVQFFKAKAKREHPCAGKIRFINYNRLYRSNVSTPCSSPFQFFFNNESGLHHGHEKWQEKLAPHEPVSQNRNNVGKDNADAHMKRRIMGTRAALSDSAGSLGAHRSRF